VERLNVSRAREPDHRVQNFRVGHVRVGKVLPVRFFHPFGGSLVFWLLRYQVVRGDGRQDGFVGRQIRGLLENIHGNRRGIELVHGRDSQQQLDGANHADGVVKFVDESSRPIVGADR